MPKQESKLLAVTGEDFEQLCDKNLLPREIVDDDTHDCHGPCCRSVTHDCVGNLSPRLTPSEERVLKQQGAVTISFERAGGVDLPLLIELGWPSETAFISGIAAALFRSTVDPLELMLIQEAILEHQAALEAEELIARHSYCGEKSQYFSSEIEHLLEIVFGPCIPGVEESVEPVRTPIRKPIVMRSFKKTQGGKQITKKSAAPEVIAETIVRQKIAEKELRAREHDKCDNRTTIRGATVVIVDFTVGKRKKKKYIIHATPRAQR